MSSRGIRTGDDVIVPVLVEVGEVRALAQKLGAELQALECDLARLGTHDRRRARERVLARRRVRTAAKEEDDAGGGRVNRNTSLRRGGSPRL